MLGRYGIFSRRSACSLRGKSVLNDEQHLAEMVSLLGKPPAEFLKRSSKCSQYWDAEGMLRAPARFTGKTLGFCMIGNWIAQKPIREQSFEMRESGLEAEDKDLLLKFVRSMRRWLPEERPTVEESAYYDFLMQAYFARMNDKKRE